jgi:hypothetical protein
MLSCSAEPDARWTCSCRFLDLLLLCGALATATFVMEIEFLVLNVELRILLAPSHGNLSPFLFLFFQKFDFVVYAVGLCSELGVLREQAVALTTCLLCYMCLAGQLGVGLFLLLGHLDQVLLEPVALGFGVVFSVRSSLCVSRKVAKSSTSCVGC